MVKTNDAGSQLEERVSDARRNAVLLAELAREHAEETEQLGRLAPPVAGALVEMRMCSLLLPPEIGGYGLGHADVFDAVREVARGDASTAWCVSIGTSNNTGMGEGLSPAGLTEVFGETGQVVAAGALAPVANSEARSGGYSVSGRFAWASGSAHSDWYVANSLVAADDGSLGLRFHVVPMASCTPIETWRVAGLSGTCSKDLELHDVFVPHERCFEMSLTSGSFAGKYAQSVEGATATGAGEANERRGPSLEESAAIGVSQLGAWSTGVAEHALAELRALAPVTKRLLADGLLAEDAALQREFGSVEAPVLALAESLRGALVEFDGYLAGGVPVPVDLRVKVIELALVLTRAARTAVLFAFDAAPSKAIYLTHPLQRCLRDLLTGLKHAAASPAMFEKVGQARLGLEGHGL